MKDVTILQLGRLKISFAWYDLWIGVYIDRRKKTLYICLLPTILLTIKL